MGDGQKYDETHKCSTLVNGRLLRYAQVTDEGSTFQGDVKKILWAEWPVYYSLFPDARAINPTTGIRYTQQEREAYYTNTVKDLLKEGDFF
jgi:hypothetical protein